MWSDGFKWVGDLCDNWGVSPINSPLPPNFIPEDLRGLPGAIFSPLSQDVLGQIVDDIFRLESPR